MKKTQLPFNPDCMTVSDIKQAAGTLRSIFQDIEQVLDGEAIPERYEEFFVRVLQSRDAYDIG